eukprot:2193978-Rhodomonas_salina.1
MLLMMWLIKCTATFTTMHRGGDENSWGAEPAVPRPSAGVFRPSKRPRFSEAPGKYGSAPKM